MKMQMTENGLPISTPEGTSVRRVTGLAITYAVGEVIIKGLNYLLLPLYLRYLPPDEYGIIAITEALKTILGLVLSFGMTGAILRFMHVVEEGEQRPFFGSMWVFLILSAGSVTLVLLSFGSSLFQLLIPSIKFQPFIQKTILAAFLYSSFALLPSTMYRARDQAKNYVLFGSCSAGIITAATIIRVVVLHQEAEGWVQAQLEGAAVIALVSSIILLRGVKPTLNWGHMKSVLNFSLPLVPHFVAHWILGVSDRMILERFVSLSQLGLYSFGYQFGQAFQVIATGINNALVPMFGRASRDRGEQLKLPDMITYYLLVVIAIALILSLIGGEVVHLLFPSNYAGAARILPWIILGYLFFAVYYIPINYLSITAGKTKNIPFSTVTAALVNLTLNLAFIRQFGIIAAAINTVIGYAVLASGMFIIARKIALPPLQYSRIAKLGSCSVLIYLVGLLVMRFNPLTNIVLGLSISITLPVLLVVVGFWNHDEMRYFQKVAARLVGGILGRRG